MKLDPGNYETPLNYCSSLGFVKKFSEAVAACTMSIVINPRTAMAYYLRARAYEGLGKENLAEQDDEKARVLGFKEFKDWSIEDPENGSDVSSKQKGAKNKD